MKQLISLFLLLAFANTAGAGGRIKRVVCEPGVLNMCRDPGPFIGQYCLDKAPYGRGYGTVTLSYGKTYPVIIGAEGDQHAIVVGVIQGLWAVGARQYPKEAKRFSSGLRYFSGTLFKENRETVFAVEDIASPSDDGEWWPADCRGLAL